MPKPQPFAPLQVPLSGSRLIEAGAGTGKTHTITDLFLRLIAERGDLQVDRILVVTFTEAATEELRDRIRARLCAARKAFACGCFAADPALAAMVKRHPDPRAAALRLGRAVADFDEAAIFTIHGFCRRLLCDLAYESGTLFESELITCQDSLVQEAVDDFWRKHLYGESGLFTSFALGAGFTPGNLFDLAARHITNPGLTIVSGAPRPEDPGSEQAFREQYGAAARAWKEAKGAVRALLEDSDRLNKKKYSPAAVAGMLAALETYFDGTGTLTLPPHALSGCTASSLREGTKKAFEPPQHEFFDLLDTFFRAAKRLQNDYESRLHDCRVNFLGFVREALEHKKRDRNVRYFDDLLVSVCRALTGRSGVRLARSVRRRFAVALIDEFQDTDPVQYSIFSEIFRHDGSALFMIGDPKQAIYSFRNADIFAYMHAAEQVGAKYTLTTNWRSEPGLIQAVNTLFEEHANPFVFPEIRFFPAEPSHPAHDELRVDGRNEPPLHLWFLRADKPRGSRSPHTKQTMLRITADAVACEAASMLHDAAEGRMLIGGRRLEAGDIAVLVRTHAQAAIIRQALSRCCVPCILHSTGYLFETKEAVQTARVLSAIGNPANEALSRAALATDIMGVSAGELIDLHGQEAGWDRLLQRFREYHDIWSRGGFFKMYRRFLLRERVKERLIGLPDGERRLTNLLHLGEELHRRATEARLGMRGLEKWLAGQIHPASPRQDEHLLRLESDEKAVKIVTIHKSKGLEFPVVFCPFLWDAASSRSSEVLFHDSGDGQRLKLDLGSPEIERNRSYAAEEALAESMRLLYVALTRARNRCYAVWGGVRGAEGAAPAYLLHNRRHDACENAVPATREAFMQLSDDDIRNALRCYEGLAQGAISVRELPGEMPAVLQQPAAETPVLAHRSFSGEISQTWRMESFSSLVSGRRHETELPGNDEPAVPGGADGTADGMRPETPAIYRFPAGAGPGSMLHDTLERLDFTGSDPEAMKSLVDDRLAAWGIDGGWSATVCSMLRNVLSATLDEGEPDMALAHIAPDNRLAELGFCFPAKRISPRLIASVFSACGSTACPDSFPAAVEGLEFPEGEGFIRGFIDLVFQHNGRFYLVDWKSNLLGRNIEDYRRESLGTVMQREYYLLQYHLYTLALHKYLARRVAGYAYESHFGCVYYVFLRGVDPARGPGYGIYRDRPPEALIRRLEETLSGDQ